MMDFMSHFEESMLCNAMRSSPGFRGDKAEFPSPAAGGSGREVEETVWRPKRQVQVPQIGGVANEDRRPSGIRGTKG